MMSRIDSDIEKFLSVAIFKMAATIPHKFKIVNLFLKRRIAICIFLIWTLIKWSEQYIIRCRQQILWFESHQKSLKQLSTHYCLFQCMHFLSVLHLQYQHILLTRVLRRNFKNWTISGTCTNNGSKIKLSTSRGHITFAWIWGLHLHGEKALQLPVKYTWEFLFFLHLRGLPVI